MKKTLIVLLILLLVFAAVYFYLNRSKGPTPSDTLRLASWNIRVFSNNSRDDTELRQICDVILDYDLVAVIELRDEKVLARAEVVLQDMGRDYDYVVSPPVGRRVKERYAFLYDRSLIDVVKPGEVFPDVGDEFIREPYYATFRAGAFDFTAIAVHVIWGDRVQARREEIQKLAEVYQAVQAMNPTEQDILLVGDFNRPPDDEKSYAKLNAIPSMIHLFDPPLKSHVEDTSLYDNIWFQAEYVKEYVGKHGIDHFDETDFADNDKQAKQAASDHRPVWAEFSMAKDDD